MKSEQKEGQWSKVVHARVRHLHQKNNEDRGVNEEARDDEGRKGTLEGAGGERNFEEHEMEYLSQRRPNRQGSLTKYQERMGR